MAEESKQAFDPDATVSQPAKSADPDATITQPMKAIDPDATVSRPTFDPDATDLRPAFDLDSTVLRPVSHGPARKNPFAPKSPPETIQANLSSLGGVNPLVAMANPILAAVPQIRRTLRHPDPGALLAGLRDQIESLEASAMSAEIADEALDNATYALCALLDESASATPWGQQWLDTGLLQNLRGENSGAEGFYARLEAICADPERNADLIELYYICLALGFEGRHRGAADGKQALQQVRDSVYALITRRRPRPEALSEHWRTPAAQAAADAALRTAERANAARAAAAAAAAAPRVETPPSRFALSLWPRRAIWSAVAGVVGVTLVIYLAALRLQDDEMREMIASAKSGSRPKAGRSSAPVPAGPAAAPKASAADALAKSLAGLPVSVNENAGTVTLRILDDAQFASGSNFPAQQLGALLPRIAEALDKLPGAIVVVGHADARRPGARYGSNEELSAARARAAARLMAPKLADPKRIAAEGRGDAEPLAANDSDANRAKNRRVAIQLKAAP